MFEKKTPLNSAADELNSEELVQRYEALRHDVMEPDVRAQKDVCGLALLMRKGMVAWMRGLSQRCAQSAVVPGSNTAQGADRPTNGYALGVERTMVNILAAMTYANTVEVSR